MDHQNYVNSSSSSSYYSYYQPHFQNPNPTPPPTDYFPAATHASAPPDPSFYHSSSDHPSSYSVDYYPYEQNPTVAPNFDYSNSGYDPNSVPPSYYQQHDQSQKQTDVSYGEGVYAYNGSSSRQIEAPTTQSLRFDDYGRPINFGTGGGNERSGLTGALDDYGRPVDFGTGGGNEQSGSKGALDDYGRPMNGGTGGGNNRSGSTGALDKSNVVRATPKVEVNEDVKSGVQKFRVKLLSEGGGGQADMDVLCQIGLDGIRILDPATSRTLKIYSLHTVTRWEVYDSNIFAFWTKSSVDIDARRIRLKSNSYTTTNILDMVAAASIQLKEMGEDAKASESRHISQQSSEKKNGFPDWMNLIKPSNEEKDHWVPDEATTKCTSCSTDFGAFVRRHHCRNCGDIFCDKCTQGRIALTSEEHAQPVRVCDRCMAEVTQRLTNANEVTNKISGFHSHEDLAKKLQEEMEKKRRTTGGIKSNVPDEKMREVECPTCTVHLQVQVPDAGSKTVECSVCQHPFLVSAH